MNANDEYDEGPDDRVGQLEQQVGELRQQVERLRKFAPVPSGRDWKSQTTIFGLPLVHIAYGRDENGKRRVAKGIIAIGQFGVGVITIAQFGVAGLFGLGQFMIAPLAIAQFAGSLVAIAQFAITLCFGLGQFATGYVAIGQFAAGDWLLCVKGFGEHVWSTDRRDLEAVQFFQQFVQWFGF